MAGVSWNALSCLELVIEVTGPHTLHPFHGGSEVDEEPEFEKMSTPTLGLANDVLATRRAILALTHGCM